MGAAGGVGSGAVGSVASAHETDTTKNANSPARRTDEFNMGHPQNTEQPLRATTLRWEGIPVKHTAPRTKFQQLVNRRCRLTPEKSTALANKAI